MNGLHNTAGRAYRVAAATTLIGLAAAVSAAPAHATPAPGSASVADQVLTITGTSGPDRITVDYSAADSVAVDLGHGTVRRFDVGTFSSVTAYLDSGDDTFSTVNGATGATKTETVLAGTGDDDVTGGAADDTIEGGSGDDHLLGGAGTDLVTGDRGDDFVDGGVGLDTELLGSGDDTAAWDPGEGNDVVSGGLGEDTLAFNGSDGAEQMALNADGTRAVFLRSPGSIRMDLDGVERLDLDTFGGADAVTLGDLTGTGLTQADIDLASSSGSGDDKVDTVVVNGTQRPDLVDVTDVAGTVHVDGLALRTVVTGSEAEDQLHVNTRDGDDQVTVAQAVNALIEVVLDLGAGQL